MNFVQRAMLYVSRKKGKTASLFLVIFVVSVFLISCFGVLNGSKRLSKDIRASVGAAFYIRANTQVSMNEDGQTEVKENQIRITQREIDQIMGTGEIIYCNPVNYGFARSDAIEFIAGKNHTEESNMGKVTALRFSALAPQIIEKTAVLAEGTHITDADSGKILISKQLADANHLSVGDKLTLLPAKPEKAEIAYKDDQSLKTAYAKVEISGIYQLDAEKSANKPTVSIPHNEIYASLDVLNALQESEPDIYTGEVDFFIADPAELHSITGNVRALQTIDWGVHLIRTNDFQYLKIAERLSSMGDLVKILLVLVSAVSALFLILLLTMRMRGRMQEAGVLLAAGIPKGQIAAGFLWEALSVALTALVLSHIVSLGAISFWGNSLLGELSPNLLNDETLRLGTNGAPQIHNYMKLNAMETLLIYLCQIIVIMASVFVSSIMILRLKPKEILSKMTTGGF